jgi:hypothetical protein
MISDFGISHALGDATITATGMIHGTPAYLAPEVARGLPTSFASDVYSLGSTLYAMVEGEPPFGTGNNAIALLHRVARGGFRAPEHAGALAPLLRKMLSPQPKRRPTMASVAESLASLAAGDADAGAAAELAALGLELEPEPEPEALDATPPATPAEQMPDDAPETAVTTAMGAPTAMLPTGKTIPVDQPTRDEAPTAVTEPLDRTESAGASVAPASTLPAWVTHEPPADAQPPVRRRRAGMVAAVLVLVVALGVGAAVLLNMMRVDAPDEAGPTPAETTATSPAPDTSAPEPAAPAPNPTPSAAEPEPTETPVAPEQRVVTAISDYYAMMPGDRDQAWALMTADYQENHAGGRGAYDAFWSTIEEVSVADVAASGPDTGTATLTYRFDDGRVVQEVTAYRLQDEGGVLKIAATDVLSSRGL